MGTYAQSCLKPLSNERILVQCSFTFWLNMDFDLTILKMSRALFAWSNNRKFCGPDIILPLLLFVKMLSMTMTLWWCSKACELITFCIERYIVRQGGILMFKLPFQCNFGSNQVKYSRKAITHICFMEMFGTLGQASGVSFPRTQQILMLEYRGIFIPFIILTEYSVSKRWRPRSDAALCSIWSGSAQFT